MESESEQPLPAWTKMATVLVYLLLVGVFVYIFVSFRTQADYFARMDRLVEGDEDARAAALKELKQTDDSLPFVCSTLINGMRPLNRKACADVILARLEARRAEVAKIGEEEDRRAIMRRGIDLFAVSKALTDESPEVRQKARQIIELTGTEQNYQKIRLSDMEKFEALLEKLRKGSEQERADAVEEFRQAGESGLGFLVGTVFAYDDPEFRLRGMTTLQVVMNDILRGSNQKRIVLVLGRRRCQLLIREMMDMKPENREVMRDLLNVSGRVPEQFFTDMMKDLASKPAPVPLEDIRPYVLELERIEKTRPAEVPSGLIDKLSGKTE
jgi:hypothetical protein